MKKSVMLALLLIVVAAILWTVWPRPEPNYPIRQVAFKQPLDHALPDGPSFEQYVDILQPAGASSSSPVLFVLGGEGNLTDRRLSGLYEAYGAPPDVVFIQAEHRGYGESLSLDADQSVPAYVTVDQALADFHAVIQDLKKEYTGPWAAAGYSYSGGLVVDLAARYPDDLDAILSSSGVVDWPFTMDAYDSKLRVVFGEDAYQRLAGHIAALDPDEMFDQIWLEREFLIAFLHGMAQYEQYKPYLPLFKLAARLPTSGFLKVLHWMDDTIADQAGWNYAVSNSKRSLSREEALTMRYTWRTWRYQQCNETGIFEVSAEPGGVFDRSHDEFVAECRALFGEEQPRSATRPAWSPRDALETLKIPIVYVAGEMDPWEGLGVEADDALQQGEFFFAPGGRHCPEKSDAELGPRVFAALLQYAASEGGQQ